MTSSISEPEAIIKMSSAYFTVIMPRGGTDIVDYIPDVALVVVLCPFRNPC